MRLFLAFAAILLGAGFATACGGDDGSGSSSGGAGGTSATGGSGGSSTTGGTGGGGSGGTGGGTSCDPGPGYPSSDAPHLVSSFKAQVLDLDGKAATDMLAQVCGTDICINAKTDAQGNVVTCDASSGICTPGINPGKDITRPAFKYGDGIGYVKFAFLLPTDTSDYDLGTHTTAALPATSAGVEMAPGSDATVGGITLSVPAGGAVEVDTLVFDTPEIQKFRAVEIPIAKAPAAVGSSLGFDMIVGTTPVETHFCPHAKLTVPNTPGYPAGTAVEFWYHGIDPGEEWAPYAGWAKVSDGAVSSDGTTISTNDGEGIPELSVFGIKKK